MVLRIFDDAVDSDATIETALEPGDRILIYTDGLTENFNSRGEMLGIDGLREIARNLSSLPLPDINNRFLTRLPAGAAGRRPTTNL